MTHEKQVELIFQRLDELFRSRTALTNMSDGDILIRITTMEMQLKDFQDRIKALEMAVAASVAREHGLV